MLYLITGGAGFIGANLVKALLERRDKVRVFDNFIGGKMSERIMKEAEYIEGDIRDRASLDKAMKGVEGVFHLAALPRVPYSVTHPEETHDVNVNGILNVLLSARDHGVKRVVFSSSSSAYGNQETYPLVEDTMIKKPIAPYALHKYIGEHYCRIFSELYNLQTISLIYFNVYGPLCDPEGAYALVIGKFIKQRKNNEPMTVCGDGEFFRDYTHVSDVARANILAMTKETVGKGETINIGNDNPHSVNEIVKLIGGDFVNVPERPGDVRYTRADITKAKQLLGWEPTITLEDGIAALKNEWGLD